MANFILDCSYFAEFLEIQKIIVKKLKYVMFNLMNSLIHLKITGRKNINQSSLFTKQEEHGKERTKAMCILKEIQNTNL